MKRWLDVDGIRLSVEIAGEGRPLLLLHGFTGAAATWAPLIAKLAPHRRTIAVDLIGHGASDAPADPERYRMERCVEDLVAVLDALSVDRTDLLGYSMGGRVALHLAAAAPARVASLLIESASPGIAEAEARLARIEADNRLADDIERDGVAAFVDRWERIPLFATQAGLPNEVRASLRDQRLRNRAGGLANSLRGMGAGRQVPLWDRLGEISERTLLVAGELDRKYTALARQMAARLPNAAVVVVPGAGHAVHLERAEEFGRLVERFLGMPAPGPNPLAPFPEGKGVGSAAGRGRVDAGRGVPQDCLFSQGRGGGAD